jgi:hypothetical protein
VSAADASNGVASPSHEALWLANEAGSGVIVLFVFLLEGCVRGWGGVNRAGAVPAGPTRLVRVPHDPAADRARGGGAGWVVFILPCRGVFASILSCFWRVYRLGLGASPWGEIPAAHVGAILVPCASLCGGSAVLQVVFLEQVQCVLFVVSCALLHRGWCPRCSTVWRVVGLTEV